MNNEEKILQMLETMQNQIGTIEHRMDSIEGKINTMQESMDQQFSELRDQMKVDHLAVGEMFEKAYPKAEVTLKKDESGHDRMVRVRF